MPAAWKQYLDELPQLESWNRMRDCANYPLELRGRDSDNAGLFEVTSNRETTNFGERLQIVRVKLVDKLKGLHKLKVGTVQEFEMDSDLNRSLAPERSDGLVPGSRLILLVNDLSFRSAKPDLQLERCGAIPANQPNLDAIRRGIQLDYGAPH